MSKAIAILGLSLAATVLSHLWQYASAMGL